VTHRGTRGHRGIKDWEQQDAFTGWRKVMFWQRGELRRIKRRAAKRDRRDARAEISLEREPDDPAVG
jgi:hypothetical protein